jgi:HJR/Mrr/RecB family endonuclease
MGSIRIEGAALPAFVSELIGYKTGVCLSREQMISLLRDSFDEDFFDVEEDASIAVRSEEVEEVTNHLLYKLGNTPTPRMVHPSIDLYHRYKAHPRKLKRATKVLDEWMDFMAEAVAHAPERGGKDIDPRPFLMKMVLHGKFEVSVGIQLCQDYNTRLQQNPWSSIRLVAWRDIVDLRELFESESLQTQYGQFFDQRFIDYLFRNFKDIDQIHWRKFEGLTAEFFVREGFDVELGPGRDDGGIDARIWPKEGGRDRPPKILVQCKREKDKVSKVIVKALWADIVDERATSGLIVTTSALSPGARKVCKARAYPIQAAERETLRTWIRAMRSPGVGVFMGQ